MWVRGPVLVGGAQRVDVFDDCAAFGGDGFEHVGELEGEEGSDLELADQGDGREYSGDGCPGHQHGHLGLVGAGQCRGRAVHEDADREREGAPHQRIATEHPESRCEARGGPLHHPEEQRVDQADDADHADAQGHERHDQPAAVHARLARQPRQDQAEPQADQRAQELRELCAKSASGAQQPPGG